LFDNAAETIDRSPRHGIVMTVTAFRRGTSENQRERPEAWVSVEVNHARTRSAHAFDTAEHPAQLFSSLI